MSLIIGVTTGWSVWILAPRDAPEPFRARSMDLVPVPLSDEDIELYYEGMSNATLWPLYHDVIATPVFIGPGGRRTSG